MNSVVFPGGLLTLTVTNPGYRRCLLEAWTQRRGVGVVAIIAPAQPHPAQRLAKVGVELQLLEVDTDEAAGTVRLRAQGLSRFDVLQLDPVPDEANTSAVHTLWQAQITRLPDDADAAPSPADLPTVRALHQAVVALRAQGTEPFAPPHQWHQAGWVANRWAELLKLPLPAKQALMALPNPTQRLAIVTQYLQSHGMLVA